MKVLIVEDSKNIRKYTAMALEKAGHAVDQAADGEEGLWCLEGAVYDVVILDVMMPRLDGFGVLQKMREAGDATHVLVLTARDTTDDKIAGLRSGADDYLVKPFDMEELLARVEALGRRACGKKSPVIAAGMVNLDASRKVVEVRGVVVELTQREYALLEYLMRRKGEVVSREEIEENIYDMNAELMSNAVNSAISLLRKKLGSAGAAEVIQTKRGHGYVVAD